MRPTGTAVDQDFMLTGLLLARTVGLKNLGPDGSEQAYGVHPTRSPRTTLQNDSFRVIMLRPTIRKIRSLEQVCQQRSRAEMNPLPGRPFTEQSTAKA